MPTRSGCLSNDKPWQFRYAAMILALSGFGIYAFGLSVTPLGFRCQTIFFALLLGIILLPLFEVWWRDCKPSQRTART